MWQRNVMPETTDYVSPCLSLRKTSRQSNRTEKSRGTVHRWQDTDVDFFTDGSKIYSGTGAGIFCTSLSAALSCGFPAVGSIFKVKATLEAKSHYRWKKCKNLLGLLATITIIRSAENISIGYVGILHTRSAPGQNSP